MSPSKVLIPVDGSPASLRALDFAIEMARQHPGACPLPLKYRSLAPTSAAMERLAGHGFAGIGWGSRTGGLKMRRRNIRFHILVKTGLVAQAIAHVARDEGNSDLSASWGRPSGERHKAAY